MKAPAIIVKRQVELRSKQWGVYVGGVLREGGFFEKDAAQACANTLRRERDAFKRAVYQSRQEAS